MTVFFSLTEGCVDYDGNHVLHDVDLTIDRGEFVAVLGDNGSGKTTLMRALLTLTPLDHGYLTIDSIPAARFREWNDIAYVPQRLLSAGAVPVSVAEVVAATSISSRTRFQWWSRSRRAAVRTALEQVGLWERRNDRLDTLSGGQQRRVLIASALAKGANVFILDEPTAGVDAENQEMMAETFRMIRDQGGTVILVTHELGTFTDLATRVVILDHGRVSYDGPAPGPVRAHDHSVHHSEDLRPTEPPSTLFGTAGGDSS
jgi:zinc transport system ATP-binding protein